MQTPLDQAAVSGIKTVIELLLDSGADREIGDADGNTALTKTAEKGHLKAVEMLLANGADVKAKSTAGWTALYLAAHLAAQNGHEAIVRSLLIKKPNIRARAGANGQTPLYQAAINNHEAVIALLLDPGAFLELGNTNGDTAAVENGHLEAVEMLLANGADVKAKSIPGWTGFHLTAQNGHEAIVRSLLIRKLDMHATAASADGQTSLYQTAMNGHEAVVALLLNSRTDSIFGSRDFRTRMPKEITDHNGHKGVVQLLSKRRR